MMELTMVIRALGKDRTVTWRDGGLHGDAELIQEFRLDAAVTADPNVVVGYTPTKPWESDPIAALAIMNDIGLVLSLEGFHEVPEAPEVPGLVI